MESVEDLISIRVAARQLPGDVAIRVAAPVRAWILPAATGSPAVVQQLPDYGGQAARGYMKQLPGNCRA